ncbi:hypothetical protein HDV05_007732 [Chytridiales sp. JEL 0842]|nr:hypothetical protein HDV05_007732 [Chytridiales sp. JEL 0842]
MALFIGRLSQDIKTADLEDVFSKFGKIIRLDIKHGAAFNFGFIEYSDRRDAEDAIRDVDNTTMGGTKIVVEWAKGGSKRSDSNECFKCGREGHWARDCREGDRGGPAETAAPLAAGLGLALHTAPADLLLAGMTVIAAIATALVLALVRVTAGTETGEIAAETAAETATALPWTVIEKRSKLLLWLPHFEHP